MISDKCPANEQRRLRLDPRDSNNQPVTLDPGALIVSVVEGDGTFEYNEATNGLVFRKPPDVSQSPIVKYHVEADPQPGPGPDPSLYLPVDVEIQFTPVGAASLGESLVGEPDGTPA